MRGILFLPKKNMWFMDIDGFGLSQSKLVVVVAVIAELKGDKLLCHTSRDVVHITA